MGKNGKVKILHHRLYAVAIFGFEAVKGKEVHHITHVPWDTREDSIELLSKRDHALHHGSWEWTEESF
jgi:hypothetical protein